VTITIERFDQRTWDDALLESLFAEGFPPFIIADVAAGALIGPVRERFGHLDIVLVDDAVPVAAGWGVPIAWDGAAATLPSGYTDSLRRAIDLSDAGGAADTFVICGGIVHPERKGTGLAGELVQALCALADAPGWPRVIAPVRPTLKHRYPLQPIDEYVGWTRGDGQPFDPWLRLHVRLGGRVLGTAPASQTMTGTVAAWEGWTGLALPASGTYVIDGGLSPLVVDRGADLGTYVEPNVWIRHR
jgi:hypothetical protein